MLTKQGYTYFNILCTQCGFCCPHNSYNNIYNLIIATGAVCVSELKHFFLMHIYFCMCGRFDVSKGHMLFFLLLFCKLFTVCVATMLIKGSKERVYGH